MPDEFALRSQFYKTLKLSYQKCLEPSMQCASKPINAHSIQNARVLSLLERRGHVIMPRQKFLESGPSIEFEEVGRNQASTFTGLCALHDRELFQPIDTAPFDENNREQLFLLAYRSATRELYATMDGAIRLQAAYRARIDAGLDSSTEFSEAGLRATESMLKSYATWQYRDIYFDRPLLKRNWDSLRHNFFWLETQSPTIAVSSLFSFDGVVRGGNVVRCALNIFPVSWNRTAVLFSYAKPDSQLARRQLKSILTGQSSRQKYEISKLVIGSIENFVIAPSWFDEWSQEKTTLIKRSFIQTLYESRFLVESPDLMLFN